MLKKLLSIEGVGNFVDYSCRGNVELRKLNIIYADNGRGKTTLAAVLRSAKAGDGSLVEGRRTLRASVSPRVRLLLGNNDEVCFANGSWNTLLTEVDVFDESFIAENVYSGNSIDVEHKRNLYLFAVGSQGVELAEEIRRLNDESTAKSGEIREKSGEITAQFSGTLKVDEVIELAQVPEGAVASKEQEIRSLEAVAEIAEMAAPVRLALPSVPWSEIQELLDTSLESVSTAAEKQVKLPGHRPGLLEEI